MLTLRIVEVSGCVASVVIVIRHTDRRRWIPARGERDAIVGIPATKTFVQCNRRRACTLTWLAMQK